ncbi:MAG: Asp-tRNA(Asn)/Glu-tRNA(Gln) amidotransferase GatCAB subunit C, partial [Oscillospiraceae bacterium]|nr:Asp-tRNA(Asn)/Glu-tRNA(Gln) amidotransferase GatCAB subunit C [Oscillospiraceae bacterium]
MFRENEYRTQYCNAVSESDIGKKVRAAGWVANIRDHGGIMFVDLRDQYGEVQIVFHNESLLEGIHKECAVSICGTVLKRDESTYNEKIATGTVEIEAEDVKILGKVSEALPFEIDESKKTKEDLRLKYRYLDLRNPKVRNNIVFRSQVISLLRNKMSEMGFLELQTPILSTSSPEGARDYLIPSRKHHGKFYALPQAPQIFKQIMFVDLRDQYGEVQIVFHNESLLEG